MTEKAIQTDGLTKRFGDFVAVDDLDLEVDEGTVVSLLGPNGAGKTTTVRMLATLIAPDGGEARVAGYDVVADAARVRELISLTGQFAALDKHLTARENLVLMARLRGRSGRGGAGDRRRAARALRRRRVPRPPGQEALRRRAAPGRPRRRPDRPPARAGARRADHRPRSPQPSGRVVDDPRARRRRRHAAADHPVPRGGRRARRSRRADRPRPRGRRRDPGAAQGAGRPAARRRRRRRRRRRSSGCARRSSGRFEITPLERAAHDLGGRARRGGRPRAGRGRRPRRRDRRSTRSRCAVRRSTTPSWRSPAIPPIRAAGARPDRRAQEVAA